MITRWRWLLSRMTKRLWFRATLFSILGVITALLALAFKDYVPDSLSNSVGADAVDKILGIIATSMLTVTTFSLSVMVTAYSAASNGVTPRATTLVMEDATTQNALATFIGSFLFSLVGIIALSTGLYGKQGRVLMFAMTILVIVLIIYTLLRWIDHLSKLGRVGETIDRVENATTSAIKARIDWPHLGASAYPPHVPHNMTKVVAKEVGYVQYIDVQSLGEIANEFDFDLYIQVVPGSFISLGEDIALMHMSKTSDALEEIQRRILSAITVGISRTFEHDPRFGLSVLSEIASRALSPAVNDPGTAIDVIGRGVRIFSRLGAQAPEPQEPDSVCQRVFLPALDLEDMFEDLFSPIARDGAGLVEVGVRLLKALGSLARHDPKYFSQVTSKHAQLMLDRAEHANMLNVDLMQLRKVAREQGFDFKPS